MTTMTMVKTAVLTGLMGTALLLNGCSGGLPKECTNYIDKMNSMSQGMAGVSAMSKDSMKQLEEEWGNMSKEEKERATHACSQGLAQMEQMEKMMKK